MLRDFVVKNVIYISPEIIILSITHIYIADFEYNYRISQLDMILTMRMEGMHGRFVGTIFSNCILVDEKVIK